MSKGTHVHMFHKQDDTKKFLTAEIPIIYGNLHTRSSERDFMMLHRQYWIKEHSCPSMKIIEYQKDTESIINIFMWINCCKHLFFLICFPEHLFISEECCLTLKYVSVMTWQCVKGCL